MNTHIRRAAAAFTLAALSAIAAAQGSKQELVNKVLQLQQPAIDVMARAMVEQPAGQILQQVANVVRQRVPQDKRDELFKEMQADVRKFVDDTTPAVRQAAQKLAPTTVGALLNEKMSEDELRELIRIRKVGSEESGLLTPNQAYFLRENLKLRLFGARMALLARDEASYREDLKLARTWISKYFDAQAKPTVAAQASLKSLQDSALNIALPDLNQSVNAIRAARAAREKGVAGGAR